MLGADLSPGRSDVNMKHKFQMNFRHAPVALQVAVNVAIASIALTIPKTKVAISVVIVNRA